jgi:hypothetical protein
MGARITSYLCLYTFNNSDSVQRRQSRFQNASVCVFALLCDTIKDGCQGHRMAMTTSAREVKMLKIELFSNQPVLLNQTLPSLTNMLMLEQVTLPIIPILYKR